MPTLKQKLLADVRVESISDERLPGENNRNPGDGIWVYLKPGYSYQVDAHQHDWTHAVHEQTYSSCVAAMQQVKKCACDDCTPVDNPVYSE